MLRKIWPIRCNRPKLYSLKKTSSKVLYQAVIYRQAPNPKRTVICRRRKYFTSELKKDKIKGPRTADVQSCYSNAQVKCRPKQIHTPNHFEKLSSEHFMHIYNHASEALRSFSENERHNDAFVKRKVHYSYLNCRSYGHYLGPIKKLYIFAMLRTNIYPCFTKRNTESADQTTTMRKCLENIQEKRKRFMLLLSIPKASVELSIQKEVSVELK